MTQNFETFQIQIQISASPADVLDAWLNPTKAKQWLAQEVEIEARPGGKFAFWGPSIMEATTKDLATQSLVSIEPGAFTFTWPIRGVERTITVKAEAEDGQTVLSYQEKISNNTSSFEYFLGRDAAELLLYRCKFWLETGQVPLWPNFLSEGNLCELNIRIHADPSDVFAAITRPEIMDTWLSVKATVDPRPGGDYRYGWTESHNGEEVAVGPLRVVEVDPGKRLVHDWYWPGEVANDRLTQVEWTIEASGGSTTLKIVHSGFDDSSPKNAYRGGWSSFLMKAKAKLEGQAVVVGIAGN